MKTEHLRLKYMKENDYFVDPIQHFIGENLSIQGIHVEFEKYYAALIPLKFILTKFFELPGVYESVISYMNSLENHDSVISNIIQGLSWKEKKSFLKINVCFLSRFILMNVN